MPADGPCEECGYETVDGWSPDCRVHPGERLCGTCCQRRQESEAAEQADDDDELAELELDAKMDELAAGLGMVVIRRPRQP